MSIHFTIGALNHCFRNSYDKHFYFPSCICVNNDDYLKYFFLNVGKIRNCHYHRTIRNGFDQSKCGKYWDDNCCMSNALSDSTRGFRFSSRIFTCTKIKFYFKWQLRHNQYCLLIMKHHSYSISFMYKAIQFNSCNSFDLITIIQWYTEI